MKMNMLMILGICLVALIGALVATKGLWQQLCDWQGASPMIKMDDISINAGGYGMSPEKG